MYHLINLATASAEEWSSELSDSHAIVLQPIGSIDHWTSGTFKGILETTLEQAFSEVMIDFLWIEAVDEVGIQVLLFALQQASKLGKTVSFNAMSYAVQRAVEVEWKRQQDLRFGSWQDLFGVDLERFLDTVNQTGGS